ncbi:MAG TPA: hypothetical protein VHP80_11185 [Candidatus Acidoferrum sp.]|nr:hypothetical protein [Candidatus Acidoferrum sp.]
MRRFSPSRIVGTQLARQVLAVFGCVVLLYVVSGLAFLHHHTQGPETTCHVCQVLHAPALAYSPGDLIPAAHQIARHSSTLELFNAENFVASHRTPRAPPVA